MYDPSRRAWRLTVSRVAWPWAGSLRSGRCWVRPAIHRNGASLRSSRLSWPTMLRSTSVGGRVRPADLRMFETDINKFHKRHMVMQAVIDGYPDPGWAEWLMGFPAGWTLT